MLPALPFYRGKVVKHCHFGQCKIWIPGLYPDEYQNKPDLLPDAEQASPIFGGNINGSGMFSYPDIGAIVWCFLENNDQNKPVYFAVAQGGPGARTGFLNVLSQDLKVTGSNADINPYVSFQNKHQFTIGNAFLNFNRDGSIRIGVFNSKSEPNTENESYIEIKKDGNIKIVAGKKLTISAPSLKIHSRDRIDALAGDIKLMSKDKIKLTSDNTKVYCDKQLNVRTKSYPHGVDFYVGK
jgi:hypothetical protein